MEFLAISVFFVGVVYGVSAYLAARNSNDIGVGMLMNTEANEQVNFQFRLKRGDDKDKMVEKINEVFAVAEARRTFQYDRMNKIREEKVKEQEELAAREENVSKLRKGD